MTPLAIDADALLLYNYVRLCLLFLHNRVFCQELHTRSKKEFSGYVHIFLVVLCNICDRV